MASQGHSTAYAKSLHTLIGSLKKLKMRGLTIQHEEHAAFSLLHVHPSPPSGKTCVAPKTLSSDLPCLVHHAVQHRPPRSLFHQSRWSQQPWM